MSSRVRVELYSKLIALPEKLGRNQIGRVSVKHLVGYRPSNGRPWSEPWSVVVTYWNYAGTPAVWKQYTIDWQFERFDDVMAHYDAIDTRTPQTASGNWYTNLVEEAEV